jgi:hypothetical protein
MPEEIRWGEMTKVSNDKGPYKLGRFQSEGHEVTAIILEPYGIQGSPMKGGQAILIPIDGDEGKKWLDGCHTRARERMAAFRQVRAASENYLKAVQS